MFLEIFVNVQSKATYIGGSGSDVNLKTLVEASHAKVMQAAAIKSNPPLPFFSYIWF